MNVARSNYTYLVRGSTKLEVIALSEISVALGGMCTLGHFKLILRFTGLFISLVGSVGRLQIEKKTN